MPLIQSASEFNGLMARMRKAKVIAVDTETTGLNWKRDKMIGLSMSDSKAKGKGWYMTCPNLKQTTALQALFNMDKTFVFHNANFDRHFLSEFGIDFGPKAKIVDTFVLAKLYDENRPFVKGGDKSYGLKPLATELFDPKAGKSLEAMSLWMEKNGLKMSQMASVPLPILGRYGAEDARITRGLLDALLDLLQREEIPKELIDLEMKVLAIAYEMEKTGARVNIPFVKRYKKVLQKEMAKHYRKLKKFAKGDFNPRSGDELRKVMLSLGWYVAPGNHETNPEVYGKDNKPRVDKYALEKFEHPFADVLVDYRHIDTLLSTFVGGVFVNDKGETQEKGILGRFVKRGSVSMIHTSFNTARAVTGRWSSSGPNLQNIDNKSEARKAFLPKAGVDLWSFDFAQIEPTVMAHYSDSAELKSLFWDGGDFHALNASKAFEVALKDVTPEQRKTAKNLALAIMYGAGKARAAKMMKLPIQEGARLLTNFKKGFPAVKKLIDSVQAKIVDRAFEAARAAGKLSRSENNTNSPWLYQDGSEDGVILPQNKFVVKQGSHAPKIPLGKAPESFAWHDKWKDPNYWVWDSWDAIEEVGYLKDPFGRKYRLTCADNYKALNKLVQGTASNLLQLALTYVWDYLQDMNKGAIILQVHDELVLELPKGRVGKTMAKHIKALMESVQEMIKDVPVKVDVAMSGKSWGDMKDVKL